MQDPALVFTMRFNGDPTLKCTDVKTPTYRGLWYQLVRFRFQVNSAPPALSSLWHSFNPLSKVTLGWGIWSYLNGVLRPCDSFWWWVSNGMKGGQGGSQEGALKWCHQVQKHPWRPAAMDLDKVVFGGSGLESWLPITALPFTSFARLAKLLHCFMPPFPYNVETIHQSYFVVKIKLDNLCNVASTRPGPH